MSRYRPCLVCGLTALLIDPWTWRAPGAEPVTFYDTECPAGHHCHGLTDRRRR